MKRFFVITLLAFAAILVCACAPQRTVATLSVSRETKLSPEAMRVWSRPIEIGFQVSGSIEGTADDKINKPNIFDQAKGLNLNLFSKNASIDIEKLSPLAKVAAFNAIQAAKADGMIITMVKEEKDHNVTTAWVKGVALKIVIYDEVSAERSDRFRYCEITCERGNCQSCPRIRSEELKDILSDLSVHEGKKESSNK